MRVLRTLLIGIGLTASLALGFLLLYWTLELKAVAQKTQATPLRLTAAELTQKGVPDNLYVELTDFTFGKPVTEKTEQGGLVAWLPVEPAAQPGKTAQYTIFFRVKVQDQTELDEFLTRSPGQALVTTGLPRSSEWRVASGPALRKAYPKLDFHQVLFLAPPQLSVLGHFVALSEPWLHDPRYESLGAWGGGGLVLLVLLSLYFMSERRNDGVFVRDAETLRTQLETERPESAHSAKALGILQKMIGRGLLAGALVLAVVLLTAGAISSQTEGRPLGAVVFVFFDLPAFLCARAAVRAFLRVFRWPTDIAVCPTGLRWRQGQEHRAILWAEVAEVHRDVQVIYQVGQTGLLGAMNQLNNPSPPRFNDTLEIKLHSGESYVMSRRIVTDYLGLVETASRLWKEDAIRRDNSQLTDAWLKSLPRRARA